jgi:Mn-dependent DtxR family transcriptional regulator
MMTLTEVVNRLVSEGYIDRVNQPEIELCENGDVYIHESGAYPYKLPKYARQV